LLAIKAKASKHPSRRQTLAATEAIDHSFVNLSLSMVSLDLAAARGDRPAHATTC
jgi:hypothetical protein